MNADDIKKVKYIQIDGSVYCPGPSKTSELLNDSSLVDESSMASYVEEQVKRLTDAELEDILK